MLGPDGYALVPDDVDLWRYQSEVATAERLRRSDPRRAVRILEAALARWDQPFGDLAADAVLADRVDVLIAAHLDHVDACNDLRLELGIAAASADEIVAGARAHPSREHRWAQAMQALFQSNRQAEALRLYSEARTVLVEQFGLDPGPDLRGMEDLVLHQAPVLLGRCRGGVALVAPTTTFVGRTKELALLDRLMDRHRIVTVTGIGGVGKSRLVTEWLTRSPRGSVATSIVFRADGDEAARHRIADALGVRGLGDEMLDPIDLVVATLEDRDRVLVVDGAEAALDSASDLITRLTAEFRHVRFVVTSRVPIGLTGEVVVPLAGLDVPADGEDVAGSAVELALDRLGPGADEDLARRLAQHVGGLPYPLELAAAQATTADMCHDPVMGTWSAESVLEEAVRDACDNVSAEALELLRSATLMPDGATRELLGAVHGSRVADMVPRSRDRVLRELVGASLLTTGPSRSGTRFRCPDPVVDLMVDGRDDGWVADCMMAASRWWLTLTRSSYFDPPDASGTEALESDHRNIVHVLDRLALHHPGETLTLAGHMAAHWERYGPVGEGAKWLRSGLDRVEEGSYEHSLGVAALVAGSGGLAMTAQQQPLLERSVAAMVAAGTDRGDVWAITNLQLAIARGWNGDLAGSDEVFDEARVQAAGAGSEWFDAVLDRYGALRFALVGEPLVGQSRAEAVADRFVVLGDLHSAAGSLYFASVLGRMGGAEHLRPVLDRARGFADAARAVNLQALIAVEQGQEARRCGSIAAPELLAEGAALTERVGNLRTASITRRDLGLYLLELGRTGEAAEQLLKAARHLLDLDARSAALALGGLSVLTASSPGLSDRLAAAAWSGADRGAGVPLGAADRTVLERLIGPPTGAADPDAFLALRDAGERLRGASDGSPTCEGGGGVAPGRREGAIP